jgi:ppGpp synthetase/RelA/SpoT-type nucleotidyltranferase
MHRDPQLLAWQALRPLLEARGATLRDDLAATLERDAGLKVHSIRLRIKDTSSLAHKLARPDRTYAELWEVTDLLGLRVITYFEDEVDRVGRLIESHLEVDYTNSVDKRHPEGRFGYRSLHYVCHMPPPLEALALGGTRARPRFEIQVRTILEHAWAEIEHDLGYKAKDAMPARARRRLQRLAGLLELADEEFVNLRDELSRYAASMPSRLAGDEHVPIDRLSVEGLLSCEPCASLDIRIADLLGRPLGSAPFFPDYLVRMLRAAGFTSVTEVREGLQHHGESILHMVAPYFAFAARTWGLSSHEMPEVLRGYPVFFLAHRHVLTTPRGQVDLSVNRVTRLARLYRELDYPEDEREATRIASLLVEAFRDV